MSLDSSHLSPAGTGSSTPFKRVHSNAMSTSSNMSSGSTSNSLSDRLKEINAGRGSSRGNDKSPASPVSSSKKLSKYGKRQRHFFDHFRLNSAEERFLIGTKSSRVTGGSRGKGKRHAGLIYIGSGHICFEPERGSDSQCVIDLANVRCCESSSRQQKGLSLRLKGGSMQVLLKDGTCFEFWIPKVKEVLQIIKDERLATVLE